MTTAAPAYRSRVSLHLGLAILCAAWPASGSVGGFGSDTPGGSRGDVCVVKTLGDSGSGSLRSCVASNRTILFDVAGTITLESTLVLSGRSYLTIDGSSAPSPGITVGSKGFVLDGNDAGPTHDIVIRNLRIRDLEGSGDGVRIVDGTYNVLLDHLSVDGCVDGNIDVTKGSHDVTIAWSVLSNCAKNVLLSTKSTRITLHHNVFVHSQYRNPWIKYYDELESPTISADFRNNLIWGWGNDGAGTGVTCGGKANVINNYYSSPNTDGYRQEKALMLVPCSAGGPDGFLHAAGNVSADDLSFDVDSAGNRTEPFAAVPVTTDDVCTGARDALAGAGVDPLDRTDLDHLSEIRLVLCDGGPMPTKTPTPTRAPTRTPTPGGITSGLGRIGDSLFDWRH